MDDRLQKARIRAMTGNATRQDVLDGFVDWLWQSHKCSTCGENVLIAVNFRKEIVTGFCRFNHDNRFIVDVKISMTGNS